ncbi:MAG: SDR family oxidoreductase [Myxococcales bacterium]|nr:SDR family oxidoreductase [Myxococcales bacterium]
MSNTAIGKAGPSDRSLFTLGGLVDVHHLDLARFAEIRASAEALRGSGSVIDVLVNAGLARQRGLTPEGYELAFETNHLGPFLFTRLVDPILAPGARVIMVASESHALARKGIDFGAVRRKSKTITGLREYGVSKLANILFANEIGRRLAPRGITTYSLNPGRIASDIWKRVPWPVRPLMTQFMKTNEEGAMTSLMCACDSALASHTGRYYNQCLEETPSKWALDTTLAKELWERSSEMVGL